MNYPNPESMHRDSSPPNTPTQNITDRATPMEDNVKRKIRVFFSIFYILNIFPEIVSPQEMYDLPANNSIEEESQAGYQLSIIVYHKF